MAGSSSAWGIEIGSYALKALRLERDGDDVRVADFAWIPHKKVLSTPDLDADEMTRLAIGQFVSQHQDLGQGPIVVSVPGNTAFARFAKLPPVEPKKVPDIVKFEAVQQIPFPIEEVEWDYKTFATEGSPDVEVGIFAITKAAIRSRLSLLGELGLYPDGVTLSPVAVCNAIAYDQMLNENSPGVCVMDIGTSSTDLIIIDQGRISVRTFPIGGHNFTEALISAFNLTYSKAEKLKAEAQTSKYRRQILSAMRPVFTDLAQDAQRSIGHYQSMHRDAELTKLIGVGSTFKLPGLRKFLAQQLQMDISRLDEFDRLKPEDSSQSQFADHAVNYGTAYGLALQGLDLSEVSINLVPTEIVRDRMWKQKIKWFGAAAAVVAIGSVFSLARPMMDQKYVNQNPAIQNAIMRPISEAEKLKREFDDVAQATSIDDRARNIQNMLIYRDFWPVVLADVADMLASTNPQPALTAGDIDAINEIPPTERRMLELVSLEHEQAGMTSPDDGSPPMPKLQMTMTVRTTQSDPIGFINNSVLQWLRNHTDPTGRPYKVVANTPRVLGGYRTMTIGADGQASVVGGRGGGMTMGEGGGRMAAPTRGTARSLGEWGGRGGGGVGLMESGPAGEGGGRTRGGRRGAGEGAGDEEIGEVSAAELNSLAALPEAPDVLPEGSKVHELTINWQVEMLPVDERDPQPEEGNEAGNGNADGNNTGGDDDRNDTRNARPGRRGG
ncbi:MAG: type IV pilus assembly protein PilM [Planctomycetota bacterium]